MIWRSENENQPLVAWSDYVASRIARRACAAVDATLCRDVGEAVGTFLAEHAGFEPVSLADIDYMIARAIWALGRPEAADAWLAAGGESRAASVAALSALRASAGLRLWQAVFAGGLLRQSTSELCVDGQWVFDFAPLRGCMDCVWELGVFAALDVLLDAIACLWDDTQGSGALGLWHVDCIYPGLTGIRRTRRDWPFELKARCARRMEQLCLQRNWKTVPKVLLMDLP